MLASNLDNFNWTIPEDVDSDVLYQFFELLKSAPIKYGYRDHLFKQDIIGSPKDRHNLQRNLPTAVLSSGRVGGESWLNGKIPDWVKFVKANLETLDHAGFNIRYDDFPDGATFVIIAYQSLALITNDEDMQDARQRCANRIADQFPQP